MSSSQKLPKHDSHNSSTEDSHGGGRPSKAYPSGKNVHKGSAPKDPDGGMPMAGPNSSHHKRGK